MKAVFDTNILIDYLRGNPSAATTIEKYREALISRITWMEVLVGADNIEEETEAREMLGIFKVLDITEQVSEIAVKLRRERRLRLPDAIVLASAQQQGCLLLTRNTRDFKRNWVEIRVPYEQ